MPPSMTRMLCDEPHLGFDDAARMKQVAAWTTFAATLDRTACCTASRLSLANKSSSARDTRAVPVDDVAEGAKRIVSRKSVRDRRQDLIEPDGEISGPDQVQESLF